MASLTFTATDPNGTIHTRTSKTRTYTHTVVVQYSREHAVAEAQSTQSDDYLRRNHEYHAACAAGTHPHAREGRQEWIDGNKADGQRHIDKYPTAQAYIDAMRAAALARIEARDWDEWHNVGWCGRLDLAQNLRNTLTARPSTKAAMILDAVVASKPQKGAA